MSLTGWGRTAPSTAAVHVVDAAAVGDVIASAGSRGVIARGLGRSYGDAALNAGGVVLELVDPGVVELDEEHGLCTVSAATSLDTVMRKLIPRGYFVPVTPGTRHVTVGGAIAADIHGKNHHVDGSFGNHLREIELVDGRGTVRRLDPDETSDEFWATVGGMGLTGVITSATFALKPVETALMRVDTRRVVNLDELLRMMAETDDDYTYSVAWIDLLSTGRSMGRSVLTRGEHASYFELRDRLRDDALRFDPSPRLTAPAIVPNGLVNKLSIRAFNELWFRKAPRDRHGQLQSISGFFHPLDGVRDWNTMYGSRGFVQYQFVVPFGAEDVLRETVRRISAAGLASFLAVLKRFGSSNSGLLSFPIPGWTLALDLPATPDLVGLLDHLDRLVASASGRIYLAKDSRATAGTIAAMYANLPAFLAVRQRLDPDGVFISDLARRLELSPKEQS
jgi:decaprenylphospho-beta-D-ribofuranose 2-oxidase